jgi:hypothetical protein
VPLWIAVEGVDKGGRTLGGQASLTVVNEAWVRFRWWLICL